MFIFTETKTEADSAGEIQKNTSGAYNLSLSSKMYDKPIQKSCNIQTSARVNVGQIQIVFTVVHTSCVQMHIKKRVDGNPPHVTEQRAPARRHKLILPCNFLP